MIASRYRNLAALILGLLCSTVYPQIVRRRTANWISLNPGVDYRIDNYEVTERPCSDDWGGLCVFLKRNFDKQSILFYTHHRQVLVILGHRKQLVLINDWEATKSGKVMVANLRSGAKKQIDIRALSIYRRHVAPDRRLWNVPEAYEFSPDDKHVLIRMVKEDVSAATAEESMAASKTYREWWYEVDSKTGRVVREYRTNKIPKKWW